MASYPPLRKFSPMTTKKEEYDSCLDVGVYRKKREISRLMKRDVERWGESARDTSKPPEALFTPFFK